MISVEDLCPAHLLQYLHMHSFPGPLFPGLSLAEAMAFILKSHPKPIPSEASALQLRGYFHWDYIAYRPIKIIIEKGMLHGEERYDRDALGGIGTCERVVDTVRRVPAARSIDAAFHAWKEMYEAKRG